MYLEVPSGAPIAYVFSSLQRSVTNTMLPLMPFVIALRIDLPTPLSRSMQLWTKSLCLQPSYS